MQKQISDELKTKNEFEMGLSLLTRWCIEHRISYAEKKTTIVIAHILDFDQFMWSIKRHVRDCLMAVTGLWWKPRVNANSSQAYTIQMA